MGISTGVYLSDDRYEEVKALAAKRHRGKISALLNELIDQALAGESSIPSIQDKDPLIRLCREFAPARTHIIEDWLKIFAKTNQPQIISTMIDGLAMEADDQMERLQVEKEHTTYGDNTSIIRAIEDTRGITYPARLPDQV